MHRFHAGLTIAVPVKQEASATLNSTLRRLQADKACLNLKAADTVLFVTGVVLPAQDYHGEMLPETFVFTTSYTGPLQNHLNDLIENGKQGICDLFRNCMGFPTGELISDQYLIHYLKSYACSSTFGSRYQCITRQEVQREKDLRKVLENYIDKAQALNAFQDLSGLQIRVLMQKHIKNLGPEYEWAYRADKKSVTEHYLLHEIKLWLSIAGALLITLLWVNRAFLHNHIQAVVFTLVAVAIAILSITPYITRKKTNTAPRPPDAHNRRLMATQLHPILNEMTAAAPLKKGRVRRYFYKAMLRFVTLFGPAFLNIPTVSTIRWFVIDNRKRLVFLSNFTNTADSYVRDFLTGRTTPRAINFMFSNGMGFPDASPVYSKGVFSDPEGYMNAVHQGQYASGLWYAHEPMLSIDIILKNRRIRNGLFKRMNESKAQQWLQLL